ncbi:MAG TPA: SHOCT domain-containing protein [Planctomycetota bacterium]|nr:SHOCT domain-containing protein [Planctomycetota bacterium]
MWLLVVVAAIILTGFVYVGFSIAGRMERAESIYREALEALRRRPHDAALRTRALDLGRRAWRLSRPYGARPGFDEVALMNDINAACAAQTPGVGVVGAPSAAPPPSHVRPRGSVEDRLRDLRRLVDSRLITEADYEARKQEILREV